MTARPVAYVRRSAANESSPGDASREVQEQAIREMAARDGHNGDVTWYVDWGRSGDEAKLERRAEYRKMLRAVEAGEVSTIYAYAMDRLHRSVVQTGKLMAACRDHRVRIVTRLEGEVSDEDPAKWLMVTTLATQAEFFLRNAKVRAKANIARRVARGDWLGIAPYGWRVDPETHQLAPEPSEDVQAVVEAYRRAGSCGAAASLLTNDPELRRRAPARKATKGRWSDQTVARILRREGVIGEASQRGRWAGRERQAFALYRLLRCHCGETLIAQRSVARSGRRFARYFCPAGRRDRSHPRPYAVAESLVLPWVLEKVQGARVEKGRHVHTVASAEGAEARREALEARLRATGRAFSDGALSEEEYDERMAAIRAELAGLDEGVLTTTVRMVGPIDPADPATANAGLRSLVREVRLGEDMRPVRLVPA